MTFFHLRNTKEVLWKMLVTFFFFLVLIDLNKYSQYILFYVPQMNHIVIQVWNNMGLNKWWQNIIFGWTIPWSGLKKQNHMWHLIVFLTHYLIGCQMLNSMWSTIHNSFYFHNLTSRIIKKKKKKRTVTLFTQLGADWLVKSLCCQNVVQWLEWRGWKIRVICGHNQRVVVSEVESYWYQVNVISNKFLHISGLQIL